MKNYTEITATSQEEMYKQKVRRTHYIVFIMLLLLGFLLRIAIATLAYHADVKFHIAWGKTAYQFGFSGLYSFDFGVQHLANLNYPPLIIYLFKFLYQVYDRLPLLKTIEHFIITLPIDSQIFRIHANNIFIALLLKLPAIISDIGIAILVYLFIQKHGRSRVYLLGIMSSILILFNPAFIYNSAYWGQIDSLPIFFILISLYLILYKKKLFLSQLFLLLAILSKQTVFIFVPILYYLYLTRSKLTEIVLNTISMLALFFLLFLPFYSSNSPIYYAFTTYWSKILTAFGTNFLTANAFNIWALLSGFQYIPDTTVHIIGLPARFLSYVFVSVIFCLLFIRLLKVGNKNKFLLQAIYLIPFTLFLFATRIHERHFILVLPFFLLLVSFNKKFPILFVFLSIFHFLNLYNKFFSPNWILLESILSHEILLKSMILLVMAIYFDSLFEFFGITLAKMNIFLQRLMRTIVNELLIISLVFFHIVTNLIWIVLNCKPPQWDAAGHSITTYLYSYWLTQNLTHLNIFNFLRLSSLYPIFVYLISLPLSLFSTQNWKVMSFVGTIFFIASIIITYFYAQKLTKNKTIGFVAAFLFSFFISINQASKEFMLDLPLTFFIVSSFLFLELFKETKKIKYIYLTILFIGFAELTKWDAFIFFIIPFIYYFVEISRNHKELLCKRNFLHVMIACVSVFSFVSPWYLVNIQSGLLSRGLTIWKGESSDPHNLLTLDNSFFHLKLIIMFQLQFIGFLIFMLSIFLVLKNKIKNSRFLLITIVFVYIVFTFLIINKNVRMLFPIMPLIAIIMALGLSKILRFHKLIGRSIVAILFVYLVFSYGVLTFGFPFKPTFKYALNFPLIGWTDIVYLHTYPVDLLYGNKLWPQEAIIKKLRLTTNSQKINIFFDIDKPSFNADNFHLALINANNNNLSKVSNIHLVAYNLYEEKNPDVSWNDPKSIRKYLINNIDYILVAKNRVRLISDPTDVSYTILSNIQKYYLNNKNSGFSIEEIYPTPDGDSIILLRNKRIIFP